MYLLKNGAQKVHVVVTLLSYKNNQFRPFQRNFWEVPHFERQKEYLQTCRAYARIKGQFIFHKHKQQMDEAGELTEASLSLGGGGASFWIMINDNACCLLRSKSIYFPDRSHSMILASHGTNGCPHLNQELKHLAA